MRPFVPHSDRSEAFLVREQKRIARMRRLEKHPLTDTIEERATAIYFETTNSSNRTLQKKLQDLLKLKESSGVPTPGLPDGTEASPRDSKRQPGTQDVRPREHEERRRTDYHDREANEAHQCERNAPTSLREPPQHHGNIINLTHQTPERKARNVQEEASAADQMTQPENAPGNRATHAPLDDLEDRSRHNTYHPDHQDRQEQVQSPTRTLCDVMAQRRQLQHLISHHRVLGY